MKIAGIFDPMFMRLISIIKAYSLLVLMSSSSLMPAVHELFHYHEHLQCTATASEVHLHAAVYECDLCDFLTKTHFFLDPVRFPPTAPSLLSNEIIQTGHPFYFQPFQGAHHLRGPPSFTV